MAGIVALPLLAMGSGEKVSFFSSKKHAAESDPARASAVAPAKTAYAWATRDRGTVDKGIVSFSLDNPAKLTSVHPLSNYAYAGCYGNGKYYFDRYRTYTENGSDTWAHIAFSSVDLTTGKVTDICDWSDEYFVINDMTYDYTSGKIYAMARNIYIDDFLSSLMFEYSCIMTINPTTGIVSEVKQFIDWGNAPIMAPNTYYTLACDLNGKLYSIDNGGNLVSFDPENDFEETVIGNTGLRQARNTQSMEFDHATGTLYWCADYSDKEAELVVVDTNSGVASVVGPTGTDSHLVGLYIPFDIPSEAAPAAVLDYKVVPDAAGGLTANLSWTNPLKSYGGYNLASISAVKVLRNDVEIASLTGTPGQQMSFADAVPAAGLYTYSVVARNAVGNGLVSGMTRWVGKDLPKAPANVGIGRTDEGFAYLEWQAPTEGLHGGVIDTETLGYKITRFPDGVIVASDCRENSYTDSSVPSTGRYWYTIESHTASGAGDIAKSVEIALGNGIESYPWSTLFTDESEFNLWTVLDCNGGSTWKWKSRTVTAPDGSKYQAQAMYEYDHTNNGDDYLISPDLFMRKGSRYKVKFAYAGANAYHTEKMELTFGKGKTAEAQSEVLKQYTMTDGTFRYSEVDLPEINETGYYNLAFHATSDAGQFNVYVTDVTVSQTVAGPEEEEPEYTFNAPENLMAKVDGDSGIVTLTWNESSPSVEPATQNIEEDFESMPKWAINPAGDYGWTYIDGDGGIPYVDDYISDAYPTDGMPLAAMVMAPYDVHEFVYDPNPPHSGSQYLLFKSNFCQGDHSRPAPKPDDWLISPALNFNSDFVFRFYCKADPDAQNDFGEPWNTESFHVGYSLTDNDRDSFIWLTDEPQTVTTAFDEWTKKEYSIPAAAKYVCIHYCTPSCGYWFMVDDIFIGVQSMPENAPARVSAATPTFQAYEVYVDDVKVASTRETFYMLSGLAAGGHVAKVVAVYAEGRSNAAVASFVMPEVSGVDSMGANAGLVTVYNAAGILLLENAPADALKTLPAGLYIVNGRKMMLK